MSQESNVPMLSQEKLREYTDMRNAYYKKRNEIITQIQEHRTEIEGYQSKISTHQVAIGKLEQEIEKARPRTENAVRLCEHCDIYSMDFEGRKPGQSGGRRWYECVICRHADSET